MKKILIVLGVVFLVIFIIGIFSYFSKGKIMSNNRRDAVVIPTSNPTIVLKKFTSNSDSKIYDGVGYKFSYPQGFEAIPQRLEGGSSVLIKPEDVIHEQDGSIELQESTKVNAEDIARVFAVLGYTRRDLVLPNNLSAVGFEGEFKTKDQTLLEKVVIIEHNGKTFKIQLMGNGEIGEDLDRAFQEITTSITFL